MSFRSPLGNVVILQMPQMNKAEKDEFYELFKHYDNIMFSSFEDTARYIQVVIKETDIELINSVKKYVAGIVEIDKYYFARRPETTIKGNKSLLPSP